MKIIYLANTRLPTERANGIQIIKMSEALARHGVKLELALPRIKNQIKDDVFYFYKIARIFKIIRIYSLPLFPGKIGYFLQNFSYALSVLFLYSWRGKCIFFVRAEIVAYVMSYFSKNLYFEIHNGRSNFLTHRVYKKSKGIIAITSNLKKFLINEGVEKNKILIAHDGVDLDLFTINYSIGEARKMCGLPLDKKIILYSGHLYTWKGVDVVAEASKYFDSNFLFVFVGGTEKDIKHFKQKYFQSKNIEIIGWKPHHEIPYYLKAADVLVLPNSGKEKISRFYTSPLKLFEYMASGKPIVASDIPSLREILNERNSILVDPDNPQKLSWAIKRVFEDQNLALQISKMSKTNSIQYSWERRAEKILKFMNNYEGH